jgi:hypothetical protein
LTGSAASLARNYRRAREGRRKRSTGIVLVLTVVTLAGLVFYFGANPRGLGPGNVGNPGAGAGNGSGSTVYLPSITFGSVTEWNTTCGNGQSYPVETVPWLNSNVPLSTRGMFFELVELIDGDVDGGAAPAPSISPSAVCDAATPSPFPSWYAVLQNPNGTNVGYYSYSQGWGFLNASTAAMTIPNGSALVFVQNPLPAGLSFALCALSDVGAPPFDDCAQL